MEKHGCTFVAFGPLDQGILLDKFDPANPPKFVEGDYRNSRKDFAPDTLRGIKAKMAQVRARFVPEGAPVEEATAILSSVASRWVLSHANVCSAIPGFRNAAQAGCNLRAASDEPMSADDAAWLKGLFG
jgi:aryl-alcohol dehydrogenase-like predicted oxidoreductase